MIKVTNPEIRLLVEDAYGDFSGDLYQTETFSEWESIEAIKQSVYTALWNSAQTYYDLHDMWRNGFLSEASPTAFTDTDSRDVVDTVRKKVQISKQLAYLGLPQVPPAAAAGLLLNNMTRSNPDYYRYIGKGFFGSLQKTANGEPATNWVKEIRYILQGKPIPNILDPATLKPVPNMGAVTNRPVKVGVPQIPPAWDEYAPRKANAFHDENGQPYNGVYIGHADHARQLETPLGQKEKLTKGGIRPANPNMPDTPIYQTITHDDGTTEKKLMGMAQPGKRVNTGQGYGIERGKLGLDLRPPVGRELDPQSTSYLGTPADDQNPALPPGARGYKPQGLDTSNSGQDQFGKYKWYMANHPELFNQLLPRVLMSKQAQEDELARKSSGAYPKTFTPEKRGRIPTVRQPITMPVARRSPYAGQTDDFGLARTYKDVPDPERKGKTKRVPVTSDYYRRMFIPDPLDPSRKILAKPERQELDPATKAARIKAYKDEINKANEDLDKLEDSRDKLESELNSKGIDPKSDPDYVSIEKSILMANRRLNLFANRVDLLSKGTVEVPEKREIGRYGNRRVAYTPEEIEEIQTHRTLHGEKVTADNLYKFIQAGKIDYDEDGELQQIKVDGTVNRKVLSNNYELKPTPGPLITVSDGIRKLAMQISQTGDAKQRSELYRDMVAQASKGSKDDKAFAMYAENYALQVKPSDGTVYSASNKLGKESQGQPWSWARTDDKGNLFFIYQKNTKTYDIPVYLPGTVDDRKKGNPTSAGAWDAASANSPEVRAYHDKERETRSIQGGVDPITNIGFEGWLPHMRAAAKMGVQNGLSIIKKKLEKSADPLGNTGKNHMLYQGLAEKFDDLVHDSYLYMQYNMANAKALDLRLNNTARIDGDYTKRQFTHFYAALKQLDRWLQMNSEEGRPNWFVVGLRKGESVFDLPLTKLSEVLSRIDKDTSDGGHGHNLLYQTKIKSNYIKNDLKKYKAQDVLHEPTWDDPERRKNLPQGVPKDKSVYTANDDVSSYNYINVAFPTLKALFDEARRNYWEFAAKDMVLKVAQHKSNKGNLAGLFGDDLDMALAASKKGGRRKGKGSAGNDASVGDDFDNSSDNDIEDVDNPDSDVSFGDDEEGNMPGPSRSRLDGSGAEDDPKAKYRQLIGNKTPDQILAMRKAKYEKMEAIKAELDKRPDMGSSGNAAEQILLKMAATDVVTQIDALEELMKEARAKKFATPEEANDWIISSLPDRVDAKRIELQSRGKNKAVDTVDADQGIGDLSPQDYLDKTGAQIDPDPKWQQFAQKIYNADGETLEDDIQSLTQELYKLRNQSAIRKADKAVNYHLVKSLVDNASTMNDAQKRALYAKAKILVTHYKTLFDFSEIMPKILGDNPQRPEGENKPLAAVASTLGSRLRRKTG